MTTDADTLPPSTSTTRKRPEEPQAGGRSTASSIVPRTAALHGYAGFSTRRVAQEAGIDWAT
jgi:hypothetical protein